MTRIPPYSRHALAFRILGKVLLKELATTTSQVFKHTTFSDNSRERALLAGMKIESPKAVMKLVMKITRIISWLSQSKAIGIINDAKVWIINPAITNLLPEILSRNRPD
ncbi:MAG: hypothetical protein F4082_04355 [Gammaproteobacteria bacterium]|nr:hypothetical protein [Gammaproteobacteria bacterium]